MKTKRKRTIPPVFQTTMATLFLIFVFIGIYIVIQYQKNKEETNVEELPLTIGKLITLPKNETPFIITVSDRSRLGNIPLLTHAENGDIVLVYPKWRKAILYRPSINKIVEVSPW